MRQKHLKLFFAFSVLSILGCSTARIGAPDLAEKPDSATDPADLAALDTLLSELPAENAETAKRIFSDLLAMGPETLQILGRKLLPPGEGDDSRIRFAFAGLATAVQGSGRESDRRLYSGSLIRMLETESDSEIRAFLIGQLQWVGNDEAVPALAPYLLDKRLIDPAARALVTIGSPAAEKVLLKALKKNELPDTVAIVKALGELRSNAAAAEIKPYTTSADENLRLTALLAIANIGNPAAQPILERMVKNETPKNRAKSLSAYLLFARRLAESGDKEACVKICRDVMEWTSDPREIGARCTALSLLTDVLDSGALDDLLAAMDNENSVYRARALDLASVDPSDGATLRWIDQMESSSPETAAQILGMLGNRGDPTAMESALDALDSADPRIRLAAIPAAGKLGGGRALPGLVDILKEGRLEEIREVQAVLLSLPPSEIIPAITRVFSDMPVASRTAVVEILGERRAAGYKDLIWSQTESEDDSLRLAALVASEHLVETTDYAELVKKLLSAENPAESAAIQNAIVAVSAKIANPEEKILPLVEAFETAEGTPRIELMNAMSRIGGRKALDAVLAEGGSKDAKKRMWAVFALANWTDSGAVDELVLQTRGKKRWSWPPVNRSRQWSH
jgi:HEAT repeat protein